MTTTTLLTSLALTLVLAACGGSATSVPEDSTTPTPTPPTPAACNSIVADGAKIPVTMVAATAPEPTGGTLVDGSYKLVEAVLYTGPGGAAVALSISLKSTLAISGTTLNVVPDTSQPSSQRLAAMFTTSGTDLIVTQACPKAEVITSKY